LVLPHVLRRVSSKTINATAGRQLIASCTTGLFD
jgi:hypothetical protein